MHFCAVCDNILHMQIGQLDTVTSSATKQNQIPLTLYCKHCPYKIEVDKTKNNSQRQLFNPCMYRSNYSNNHPLYYATIVNKYSFDDPTLPCMNTPCQNKGCESHKENILSEILFIRHDHQDMQYLYLCKHCRQCWCINKQNETEVLFDFSNAEESQLISETHSS
jgi:hypothetical protein